MKQCKNYKRYKGIRIPRCNGGKGCSACKEKYLNRELQAMQDNCEHELKYWAIEPNHFTGSSVVCGCCNKQLHNVTQAFGDSPSVRLFQELIKQVVYLSKKVERLEEQLR